MILTSPGGFGALSLTVTTSGGRDFLLTVTRKSEEASGRPEATSTQGEAPAAASERDARHATARTGRIEEEWDSADEALSERRGPCEMVGQNAEQQKHHIATSSKQSRRLTFARNFSPRRLNAKKAHRIRRHTYKQRAAQ